MPGAKNCGQSDGGQALNPVDNWQQDFYPRWHARWAGVQQTDLRALAWLLDAPNLLARDAPQWQGKIATLQDLGQVPDLQDLPGRLLQWQQAPQKLHQAMQGASQTRLGRYAEKLLGFYLQESDLLYAAGLQLRRDVIQEPASGNSKTVRQTLGEFDFLLHPPQLRAQHALLHWEFATKFYLCAPNITGRTGSDYFLGPNLADSLGAKMRKILFQQLALGQLAAQGDTSYGDTAPVVAAKAFIKGWLFYPFAYAPLEQELAFAALCEQAGLALDHCRGYWCTQAQLPALCASKTHSADLRLMSLPRLAWLAPAVTENHEASEMALPLAACLPQLQQYFANDSMPLLLALMRQADRGGQWQEIARVFVVADAWQQSAAQVFSLDALKGGGRP